MKNVLIPVALLALLIPAAAGALEVSFTGERLSLHAEQVPLQIILGRIGALGIRVRIEPELNPTITASFRDREIRQALNSILKDLNHVLVWESIPGPLGPIPKLAEIQVFRPGKKALMRSLGEGHGLSLAGHGGALFVKDEILIRLKAGSGLQDLQAILRRLQGRVVDGYPDLGLYRIRLPEGSDVPSLVEALEKASEIAGVEPNYAQPLPTPSRGQDVPIPTPRPFDMPVPPGGVPVAIVDTGLMSDAGLEGFVRASLDALNPDQPISDSLGHGTQMALIASGAVRPFGVQADPGMESPIIPIRAFDEKGFTSNFLIMQGIDFALKNGARVMSLSWGSETRSGFLEEAFARASGKGLIIVAAAGNEPTGRPVYPAAFPSVIAVGAVGPDGKTWERSNDGDFVSLYAPGFAALPVGYKGDPGTYAGTSISTAFAANLIANVLSRNPKASKEDVLKALTGR